MTQSQPLPTGRRYAAIALLAIVAGAMLVGRGSGVLGAGAMWILLMVLPGAFGARLIDNARLGTCEALLAGAVISPVLLTLIAVATLFAGGNLQAAVLACLAVASSVSLAAILARRPALIPSSRRETVVLLIFLAGLLLLVSTLPFTREWWRIRSDAWFHAAVVAQIRDFGLPPEDPYFAGLPLQYMWFYHVLVATLSEALHVDSFWTMALVNAHATVALVLAGYRFASVLRPRLQERIAGMATLVFAFNAAFWVLLPVKLVKAFMGDVRGGEEIARTFALTPLHYNTAYGFMNIYYNQEFFLDKFMVATAFGLALVFMTSGWAAAIDFLRGGQRSALLLLAASIVGMLGFHSLVGFVFLVGLVGGSILMHFARGRVDGYQVRPVAVMVGVSVLCFLAMTPYLYQVMHAKEREQVFPLDFSFPKIAGILIANAFVIAVALFSRPFWRDRSPGARFLGFGTAAVTVFCFSISLPGPNTYDKLGYFMFIPLAMVAGFAMADSVAARRGRARIAVAAAWVLLFFVPVNAIAFVSCFGTPSAVEVTPAEARLSEWVRAHTPRDAIIIDDDDRVALLVTGPRRYFWGTLAYAEQWGYPKSEMSRRRHLVESLYGEADLDVPAQETLASVELPLFVVVRPQHTGCAVARAGGQFETVYSDAEIALVRVIPTRNGHAD